MSRPPRAEAAAPEGLGLPSLGPTKLPVEQLNQLKARMAGVEGSIKELERKLLEQQGMASWPDLLASYNVLLSQSHSLLSSLSSANPTLFTAFHLRGDADDGKVTYVDRNNPLPRVLVQPALEVAPEKEFTASVLLSRNFRQDVKDAEDALVAGLAEGEKEEEEEAREEGVPKQLESVRARAKAHDDLLAHASGVLSDLGADESERWSIRIPDDDSGKVGERADESAEDEGSDDEEMEEAGRGGAAEAEAAKEEATGGEAEDEDEDEDMEEVET